MISVEVFIRTFECLSKVSSKRRCSNHKKKTGKRLSGDFIINKKIRLFVLSDSWLFFSKTVLI